MKKDLCAVILAAGKGERMKSYLPKVMHEIIDKPMIGYVLDVAKKVGVQKKVVVLGFGKEKIMNYLKDEKVEFCIQVKQEGTAHALLCAREMVSGSDVLVLYGDVPLISELTLRKFLDFYGMEREITFMVTELDNPSGYGRVILSGEYIDRIVEENEASEEELRIKLINTGICVIPADCLSFLDRISNQNTKKEFYLTDICTVARMEGRNVRAFFCPDSQEVLGINTKRELFLANSIMKEKVLEKHLKNGVTICGTEVTIGVDVKVGTDTKIGNNVIITGKSVIGEGVEIGSNVVIKDCVIEDGARIGNFVYMENRRVRKGEKIPNFYHV